MVASLTRHSIFPACSTLFFRFLTCSTFFVRLSRTCPASSPAAAPHQQRAITCVHKQAISDRAQHPSSLLLCQGTAARVANQRCKERQGAPGGRASGRTWQSVPGPSYSHPEQQQAMRACLPSPLPPRTTPESWQTSFKPARSL